MLQKKNYQRTLSLLFLFCLFFFSNASAFFHVVWLAPGIVYLESVVWLILAAISVWILIKKHLAINFFYTLKRNWAIFPFLIFSGFSIFWSIYWEISLFRWLILVCTIITGTYIGLLYDGKRVIELLSVFGIYILLLCSIIIIFAPDIGVMHYYTIQGAWRGMYWHKNHMGLITSFVNMLFLINFINSLQGKVKHRILWVLLYAFSLVFVYKTDSVAAYFTTIGLHGVIFVALVLLKYGKSIRKSHYLIFFIAIFAASIILFMNLDNIFAIFNRNTSLTGRIPMWTHLFSTYFKEHPVLGYGFNAFWYIDSFRVEIGLAAGYPDPVIIADNGFIDILMNTGFIGIFLFLIFYVGAWWRCLQYARNAVDINDIFPVILMTFTLLANISWSLIFENESFFMLLMISVLSYIPVRRLQMVDEQGIDIHEIAYDIN